MILRGVWCYLALMVASSLTVSVSADDDQKWSWGADTTPASSSSFAAPVPGIPDLPRINPRQETQTPGEETEERESVAEDTEGRVEGRTAKKILGLGDRICALGIPLLCKNKKSYTPSVGSHYGPPPKPPGNSYGPPPIPPTSSYATLSYDAAPDSHPHTAHSPTSGMGYPQAAAHKPLFVPPKPYYESSTSLSPSYTSPTSTHYYEYPPFTRPASPTSLYAAPTQEYATQKPTFVAPTYVAPEPNYQAPEPTYAAPSYVSPTPTYAAPNPTYAAPESPPTGQTRPTTSIVHHQHTHTHIHHGNGGGFLGPSGTRVVNSVNVGPSIIQAAPDTFFRPSPHLTGGSAVPPVITQVAANGFTPSPHLPAGSVITQLATGTSQSSPDFPGGNAVPPVITQVASAGSGPSQQHLPGPIIEAETPPYSETCQCVPRSSCAPSDIVARAAPLDIRNLVDPRSGGSNILSNATVDEDNEVTTPAPPEEDEEATVVPEDLEVATEDPGSDGEDVRTPENISRVRRDTLGDAYLIFTPTDNTTHLEQRRLTYAPGVSGCGAEYVCCQSPLSVKPRQEPITCGRRQAVGLLGRVKNPHYIKGNTEFGEYPWQAAITKPQGDKSVFVCGAALIDHQHVLTAAHCVNSLEVQQLKVRLGEWDVKTQAEFYGHLEIQAASVTTHPQYYAGNLHNDIAVITLQSPVDFSASPHISPVCLPEKYSSFVGQRCHSSGWGKNAFGSQGKYQSVLQEVEVPVVGHQQCQAALRNTRLGPNFSLHQGMLCAGGEEGQDTCQGDGGGPLVCAGPEGRFHLAGLVSWGVGCGLRGVPGVYVDVAHYLDWLHQLGVINIH